MIRRNQPPRKYNNQSETDHILEIGTGWGALAIRAVQRFGCQVTSLTLSIEQKNLAELKIEALGLSHLITVLLCDYRMMKGAFDKIISCEMIEAVGKEFLPVFFKCCKTLLKQQGKFFSKLGDFF